MTDDRLFDPPGPAVTDHEAATRRGHWQSAQTRLELGCLDDAAAEPRSCPACGNVTGPHDCPHHADPLPLDQTNPLT